MATPTTPAPQTTSTQPLSRARHAYEEAKRRAPVEWTLDEAHELIIKWAGSTTKDKAKRAVITEWLGERMSTAAGKAVIGALIASPIGIPMIASLMGKRQALAERIADEFAARAATELGVGALDVAKTVVTKHLPRGAMKLVDMIFEKFDSLGRQEIDVTAPQPAGALSPPVHDVISDVERACAEQQPALSRK